MTLPALPQMTGDIVRDFYSMILYLQRIRDSFPDAVVSTPGSGGSYSDTQAQNAIGNILQATATVSPMYNSTVPFIQMNVTPNAVIEQVVVSSNGTVIGHRKQLNFVGSQHMQYAVSDDTTNDQVNITSNAFLSRYIASNEHFVVADTFSAVVPNYFRVDGSLQLQGDATLRVL